MKKDAKRLSIDIRQSIHNILTRQANIKNQSVTKYVESLITKKEKFSPSVIKTINEVKHILEIHISNYKALNAAISNLNQLTYSNNINELPSKNEIIETLESVRKEAINNREVTQIIITKLQPFATIKQPKNTKNEDM